MVQVNNKIGLYFGSFNPIHTGHLIIASQMVENSDLDQMWFVISPQNPLKKKKSLLANHHRLYMVKEAIMEDDRFRASDIEFDLPQPSYTIHTLTVLAEKYPRKEFVLIMGSDNLATLQKWKNYREILDNYQLYIYPRPGYDVTEWIHENGVHLIDAPRMEISASMIRESVKKGKDMRYLLPDNVLQYIWEMHFYK